MEFTLNVNLNLSEATERTLNRLADAFGSTKPVAFTGGLKPMSDDEAAAVQAEIEHKETVVEETVVEEVKDERKDKVRLRLDTDFKHMTS